MYSKYSGPPLKRPPLENGKIGLIRGVASREGVYQMQFYLDCSLKLQSYKSDSLWRGWPHIGGVNRIVKYANYTVIGETKLGFFLDA